MKLYIARDDGEVLGFVPEIETYDLSKRMAQEDLCEDIQRILAAAERGR